MESISARSVLPAPLKAVLGSDSDKDVSVDTILPPVEPSETIIEISVDSSDEQSEPSSSAKSDLRFYFACNFCDKYYSERQLNILKRLINSVMSQ